MGELLGRLSSVFVEPAPRRVRRAAPEPPVAPSLALLCPPDEAPALGSAVALAAAGRAKAPIALLLLWRPGARGLGGVGALPARGARSLVSSLVARDLRANASGRVVRVDLPDDADAAHAGACRALAATDAPAVLAVAGPRTETIDEVLRDQDLILLAAEREADSLTSVALDRLSALGPPVAAIPLNLPPVSRALALAGLTPPTTVPLPELT